MTQPNLGWPVTLAAGAVTLRPPRRSDAREWAAVRLKNQQWLERWEPTSADSWQRRCTPAAWRRQCAALRRNARDGIALPTVVEYDGRFVGQVNAFNVVHGALRSATLGYWVDQAVAGRGIAPAGVAVLIDHLLGPAGLHRVEIDIRPDNEASLRVAAKLGMRREGYYERFLDIDGAWRDHIAFAVTKDELEAGGMLSRLSRLPTVP